MSGIILYYSHRDSKETKIKNTITPNLAQARQAYFGAAQGQQIPSASHTLVWYSYSGGAGGGGSTGLQPSNYWSAGYLRP